MAFSYDTSTSCVALNSVILGMSNTTRCGFVAIKHKETVVKLPIFTVPWDEIMSCMIQNGDSFVTLFCLSQRKNVNEKEWTLKVKGTIQTGNN